MMAAFIFFYRLLFLYFYLVIWQKVCFLKEQALLHLLTMVLTRISFYLFIHLFNEQLYPQRKKNVVTGCVPAFVNVPKSASTSVAAHPIEGPERRPLYRQMLF